MLISNLYPWLSYYFCVIFYLLSFSSVLIYIYFVYFNGMFGNILEYGLLLCSGSTLFQIMCLFAYSFWSRGVSKIYDIYVFIEAVDIMCLLSLHVLTAQFRAKIAKTALLQVRGFQYHVTLSIS